MITQAYLDELWERIESLERRLITNPDDMGAAMLLDCCLRNYQAKQKIYINSLAQVI